jgi:Terminase large subunit, T4likevirus-type, N-terminal
MTTQFISPQPGGQERFLSITTDEALFGGAAGPGKSWDLVIDVLGLQFERTRFGIKAIEHKDYRGVIFRRKTTQFTKLIDESKKYYPDFGAYYITHRTGDPGPSWNFPSGARIFICHMEQEGNKEDHQGQEYQYIGFDELTQFTLTQYLYLWSRLRSNLDNNGVRFLGRMRATTNPTGRGLMWVKKRFIKTNNKIFKPNQTYHFIQDSSVKDPNDNPTGIQVESDHPRFKEAKSRVFVPGNLFENKILMKNDPNYMYNIMQMGEKMEKALLKGDWDAFGGDFFSDFDRDQMVIPPFPIPKSWGLIGSVDPGWSSPCSFGLRARDVEGNVYRLFTYYVREKSPQENAKAIKERILGFKWTQGRMPDRIVAGHDAFAHKDRHSIITSEVTFADKFEEQGLHLEKSITDRFNGWINMKTYMRNTIIQKDVPLNKRKNCYYLFMQYNDPLIDEITSAQTDEGNPDDIEGGGNDPNVADHALDDDRYNLMALPAPAVVIPDILPQWLKEYYKDMDESDTHTVMSV